MLKKILTFILKRFRRAPASVKYPKAGAVKTLRQLHVQRRLGQLVNKDIISKLDPCKNRFDNYVKHYSNKSFTKQQFMGLKNITHDDKLWVAFRLLPKANLRFAAAEIARTVLHLYEEMYPNDNRPRRAIEAAEAEVLDIEAAKAAYSAAHAAYATANATANATYAATAAAYASAASAAYAASDAAYSAATDAAYVAYASRAAANADYAATAATYATAFAAAADKLVQEKLIRKIVLKYWR